MEELLILTKKPLREYNSDILSYLNSDPDFRKMFITGGKSWM